MPGDTARENGKKGGRPKGSKARHTLVAEAIRAHLIEEVDKQKIGITKALISKAKSGDVTAIKEIYDRVLGKPKEQVGVPGEVNVYNIHYIKTEQLIAIIESSESGVGEKRAGKKETRILHPIQLSELPKELASQDNNQEARSG